MTLVLSEVSKFGVVMVADSAITTTHNEDEKLPSGEKIPKYVRLGSEKVKRIPKYPAGISFYGMGRIAGLPTDIWMEDYLKHEIKDALTLDQVGERFTETVNETFFKHKQHDLGGFHFGAVVDAGTDHAYPILYHIFRDKNDEPFRLQKDNPDGRDIPIDRWRSHLDLGHTYYLRNGLHEPFAVLQDRIFDAMYELTGRYGIQVPYPPTLTVHERFDRLQLGLMCDLISMSNHIASVGRPITSLTIDLDGNVNFSSALNDVSYV